MIHRRYKLGESLRKCKYYLLCLLAISKNVRRVLFCSERKFAETYKLRKQKKTSRIVLTFSRLSKVSR